MINSSQCPPVMRFVYRINTMAGIRLQSRRQQNTIAVDIRLAFKLKPFHRGLSL